MKVKCIFNLLDIHRKQYIPTYLKAKENLQFTLSAIVNAIVATLLQVLSIPSLHERVVFCEFKIGESKKITINSTAVCKAKACAKNPIIIDLKAVKFVH